MSCSRPAISGLKGRDELLINSMAHLGTLFAVLAYFWRDILRAFRGGLELIGIGREAGNALSGEARLALCTSSLRHPLP